VKDEMYTKAMGPYIEYWEGILNLVKTTSKAMSYLVGGFVAI
jgi:hypothetical protein